GSCDENGAREHAKREGARRWAADRFPVEDPRDTAGEGTLRRSNAMGPEQQAGAFVASDTDEQLGIVRVDDVSGEHGIVRRLFAQLMGLAGKQPDERVEPEQGGR